MSRIKLILFLMIVCLVSNAQTIDPNGKRAILMVHFGTTFDDTRAATIDAINEKVRKEFSGFTVVEAYTSRIIIDRLKKRGIEKLTPKQALLKLAADGYTDVVVQGTNIIEGIETEVLRKDAETMSPFFSEIRVGRPLLYSVKDGEKVVEILSERYSCYDKKNNGVVFVGHGTSTPANAMYSQVDYMFSANGMKDFHVATVEGYPTYATTLEKLRSSKIKTVTLVPFMFVAGDHARNDIDGEWREELEKEGFAVNTVIEGLGQVPEIQNIYLDHIREAIATPVLNASQQKSSFIKENL